MSGIIEELQMLRIYEDFFLQLEPANLLEKPENSEIFSSATGIFQDLLEKNRIHDCKDPDEFINSIESFVKSSKSLLKVKRLSVSKLDGSQLLRLLKLLNSEFLIEVQMSECPIYSYYVQKIIETDQWKNLKYGGVEEIKRESSFKVDHFFHMKDMDIRAIEVFPSLLWRVIQNARENPLNPTKSFLVTSINSFDYRKLFRRFDVEQKNELKKVEKGCPAAPHFVQKFPTSSDDHVLWVKFGEDNKNHGQRFCMIGKVLKIDEYFDMH